MNFQKNQFQLLGAASIFLASKMIEPSPVSATTLVRCTADTYDRDELLVSSFFKCVKNYLFDKVLKLIFLEMNQNKDPKIWISFETMLQILRGNRTKLKL